MADTAIFLIMGLVVTFGAVGGVLYKIWKKKRDAYNNFDYEAEGGLKDDNFMMMI